MYLKEECKIYHNLSSACVQDIEEVSNSFSQTDSLIAKQTIRNETPLDYFNKKISICIKEVDLDTEWKNIFGIDKSAPTFIFSATSI